MIIAAVICLILGITCGQLFFLPKTVEFFSQVADYALILLMFSVGISVGENKLLFRKNDLLLLLFAEKFAQSRPERVQNVAQRGNRGGM